jgi:hypothetical protein
MNSKSKVSVHLVVILVTAGAILTAGCLGGDDDEKEKGVSAFSLLVTADRLGKDHEGVLELVVVTAMEPTSNGRALSWKFAYNDVTSGPALSSLLITIDHEGESTMENGEPLQKSPVRNWSLDSSTAYSKARDRLIDDGVISSSTKVTIQFLYLLGDSGDNNGCEWMIGMILGSEEPLEVIVKVDGNSGSILELGSSKGQ